MAMSLNRAQLIGNVTRDPEVRQIPGGTTVASFSIATFSVKTPFRFFRYSKCESPMFDINAKSGLTIADVYGISPK